jgi:hypothetical protein
LCEKLWDGAYLRTIQYGIFRHLYFNSKHNAQALSRINIYQNYTRTSDVSHLISGAIIKACGLTAYSIYQSDKNVVVREEFAKQPWNTSLTLKEERDMATKINKRTQWYIKILRQWCHIGTATNPLLDCFRWDNGNSPTTY